METTHFAVSTEPLSAALHEKVDELCDKYGFLVAETKESEGFVLMTGDDEIIAYALISPRGSSAYDFDRLFVAPEHRRKGLGGWLIHKCEEYVKSRSDESMFLMLDATEAARQFWINRGYETWVEDLPGKLLKLL